MEIVKRVIDAFNRRDADAMADLTTLDVEWFPAMGALEGEVFRGREGVATYWGRLDEAWEEYRLVVDEYRDLGGCVLILGRVVGRGRGSGVPVETPTGGTWDLRGGKVRRTRAFLDHGEALRAAGLPE